MAVQYGGQAVMEGVMLRGRRGMAVAVRDRAGQIVLHVEPTDGWVQRSRVAHWPLVRGLLMLADTLRLGVRALLFSALVAARAPGDAQPDAAALTGPVLWSTLALSLGFAVGLFFLLPLAVVILAEPLLPSRLAATLLEGLLRLGLLLGYLLVIGRRPEVRRLFGYHGAEHKTINALEAGAALTPASVRRFSRLHPRCGTGFLLVVVVLATAVFALLGQPPLPVRIAARVALLPIIVALAYEYIRFTARHYGYRPVRWLAAPSLALQRLTTREPDDAMLAVAIAALDGVRQADTPGHWGRDG